MPCKLIVAKLLLFT